MTKIWVTVLGILSIGAVAWGQSPPPPILICPLTSGGINCDPTHFNQGDAAVMCQGMTTGSMFYACSSMLTKCCQYSCYVISCPTSFSVGWVCGEFESNLTPPPITIDLDGAMTSVPGASRWVYDCIWSGTSGACIGTNAGNSAVDCLLVGQYSGDSCGTNGQCGDFNPPSE